MTIPTQTYIAFAYKSIIVQELLSKEFQKVLFHFSLQLKKYDLCVQILLHDSTFLPISYNPASSARRGDSLKF